MHKLVTGMNTHKGFTLIEILIVIIITGITLGFALIAFGDFGESKRLLFAAEQLVNTLKLAQQQAILETTTLGLRLDKTSYQILRFQNLSGWHPVANKGIFKTTYFPKNTVITLKTTHKLSSDSPAIIINSMGDMTPFTLNFGTNQNTTIVSLTGKHDGSLNFSTVKTQ